MIFHRASRHLTDQLAILTPLFMALTAGTPFYKGYVSDWDARWNVIAQCVDDRTPGEKGIFELEDLENLLPGEMVDVLSKTKVTDESESNKNCHDNDRWISCKVVSVSASTLRIMNPEGINTDYDIKDPSTLDFILPGGVKTNPKHQLIIKSRYDTIS